MTRCITRLQLHDFRNYCSLDISVEARLVALVGDNGAGKTNLLEAISVLTAGRGLRRSDLSDMSREQGSGGWAVSATVTTPDGDVQLGTGLETSDPGRKCRVDRQPVSSVNVFSDYLRIVWLTPAQDGLFTGSAGERRRFLDRLVLAVDAKHGTRVSGLEKALRNRNRLLEDERYDPAWASAIEREIAEIGVSVAAARHETMLRLGALIERNLDKNSPFPHAVISLTGEIENQIGEMPATEIEDWFREELRRTRARDRVAGRTLAGPQTCDLTVLHGPKQVAAGRASTGEQKALLIGLILAHARLVLEMTGIAPIILLDEIAAHLDPGRRVGLYELLESLGGQVWMTGTDETLFDGLGANSCKLHVQDGRVK